MCNKGQDASKVASGYNNSILLTALNMSIPGNSTS